MAIPRITYSLSQHYKLLNLLRANPRNVSLYLLEVSKYLRIREKSRSHQWIHFLLGQLPLQIVKLKRQRFSLHPHG